MKNSKRLSLKKNTLRKISPDEAERARGGAGDATYINCAGNATYINCAGNATYINCVKTNTCLTVTTDKGG